MNRESVLVIALARMGDLLQCFPAISDLNRQSGANGVALLVQKDVESLARLHPAVRVLISFDGDELLGILRKGEELSPQTIFQMDAIIDKMERLKPELVVNLTQTSFSGMLACALSAAEVRGRVYYPGMGTVLRGDWTKYFFTLLSSRACNGFNLVDLHRAIAGGEWGERYDLSIPQAAQKEAGQLLAGMVGKYRIVIGIGAKHVLRRWPTASWISLVKALFEREDAGLVLVGSEPERDAAEEIQRAVGSRCLNLCGRTNFEQLSGVLRQCDLYVGADSGPLHLAAALGIPCIGIYLAMASAWETAPYLKGALSLEPDVPCHPCSEEGNCRDAKCHRAIWPEAVARLISSILHNGRPTGETGCIVRQSEFDESGWLSLTGQKRAGDELRLVWGEIIRFLFDSKDSVSSVRFRKPDLSETSLFLRDQIQQVQTPILATCRDTLERFKRAQNGMRADNLDALIPELPALKARYPECRPLFDLYAQDYLGFDDAVVASQAENILAAQDKLLRRLGRISELLTHNRPFREGISAADVQISACA